MIVDYDNIADFIKGSNKNKNGKVFTNGVFDILHRGHVEYLKEAKKFGELLIVGINSDQSVKRLKGEMRPINPEMDRAIVIDSLKCVDIVVIFDQDTPYDLIKLIKPSVLVKGGDYDPDITDQEDEKYIVGRDIVIQKGGRVEVVDLLPGRSSTNTINKIMER